MGGGRGGGSRGPLATGQREAAIHQFSTLFTAQDVRDHLADDAGLAAAIDWCHKTGVTKVYLETFRDGYQPSGRPCRRRLNDSEPPNSRFRAASPRPTWASRRRLETALLLHRFRDQNRVQSIFEYTAGLFDEIMIDDFWFTDCTCPQCDAARRLQTVNLSGRPSTWRGKPGKTTVAADVAAFAGAHSGSGQEGKPNVKVILKYPEWYDRLQERGYDVVRETADFDKIWVGTETRDRDQGGSVPYQAYFIMRWLGALGGRRLAAGGTIHSKRLHPPTWSRRGRRCWPGRARACCSPMAFWDARAARPTSRRCAPASRSCWLPPSRCACARRLGSPPINRPTVTAQASRIFLGTPECWGCRCCPRPVSGGGSGGVLLDARAEGPELTLKLTMYILSGGLRCSPRVWRNSSTRRS